MFYEIYERLCLENNEKPYQLPIKLGAKSNSVVAQWQKGSVPRATMLQKIADYFHVSVEYLLGESDKKENPTDKNGEVAGGLGDTKYFKLNDENRALIDSMIEKLLKSQSGD